MQESCWQLQSEALNSIPAWSLGQDCGEGICHMECLAKGQEKAQAASSQIPLGKPGDGFEWSVNWADAKRIAGDHVL